MRMPWGCSSAARERMRPVRGRSERGQWGLVLLRRRSIGERRVKREWNVPSTAARAGWYVPLIEAADDAAAPEEDDGEGEALLGCGPGEAALRSATQPPDSWPRRFWKMARLRFSTPKT